MSWYQLNYIQRGMPRKGISKPHVARLFLWVILLSTACQAQPSPQQATPPLSPAEVTADAEVATPRDTNVAVRTSTAQTTEALSRAVLEEYALEVAVYQPRDPTACGLPTIPAPTDISTEVLVFFACQPTNSSNLNAVPARRVTITSDEDPKRIALQALLAGPTSEEVRAGYLSNFGAASQNIGFNIDAMDGGLAVVDFDAAIMEVPLIFVGNMDAIQIVATLGQFPDVRRVAILVDGQLWCKVIELC
jgi:hypothetical protein